MITTQPEFILGVARDVLSSAPSPEEVSEFAFRDHNTYNTYVKYNAILSEGLPDVPP